jgi:hypothetical protein
MYAAVGSALDRAFPDHEVTAVAAIHTRNDAGEIHYHVHVLVAKFARDRRSGRVFSLNSKAGGNTAARVRDIKVAWKESVDAELERTAAMSLTRALSSSAFGDEPAGAAGRVYDEASTRGTANPS